MSRMMLGFTVVAGLVLLGSAAHAGCNDPRVATVRAQIDGECQCTGNHGQFVSCVAHHVGDAVRNNELDTNCKGAVTRCAARSTGGKKSGFVTCASCRRGTCTRGVCGDGFTMSADRWMCPAVVNGCSTKSRAALCAAKGGVAGSGSCCDATCVASPSVAFLGD